MNILPTAELHSLKMVMIVNITLCGLFFVFVLKQSLALSPRLKHVMQSQLTAASVSQVQEILLPQPSE